MHGRTVRDTFEVVPARPTVPSGLAVMLVAVLALVSSISGAKADLLEYTYNGSPYNIFFNPLGFTGTSPLQGSSVTGSIVVDLAGASLVNGYYEAEAQSFSLTDGITSYSGPDGITAYDRGAVTLDLNHNIVAWTVSAATNGYPNAPSSAVITSGNIEPGTNSGADGGTIFNADGTFFNANSSAPGSWSGPTILPTNGSLTSTACVSDVQNSVSVQRDLGNLSASGLPYVINATFKPASGSTLARAEADCGVSQFNWQQTVQFTPSSFPLLSNSNPFVPTPLTTPFFDAPFGGYVNLDGSPHPAYCNYQDDVINGVPTRIYSNPSFAFGHANPFYFQPNGPAGDCFSLSSRETSTTLSFTDSPANGGTSPDFTGFTTCLVGVDANGEPVPLPAASGDCFNWESNYSGLPGGDCVTVGSTSQCPLAGSGGQGGIISFGSVVPSGAPGEGTGGIQLLAAASVPEPAGITLLSLSVVFLAFIKRFRQVGRSVVRIRSSHRRNIVLFYRTRRPRVGGAIA